MIPLSKEELKSINILSEYYKKNCKGSIKECEGCICQRYNCNACLPWIASNVIYKNPELFKEIIL